MVTTLQRVSNLSFDLRRIAELANAQPNCLRADLGQLNYSSPIMIYELMGRMAVNEQFEYTPTLGNIHLLRALKNNERQPLSLFEEGELLVTAGGQAALYAIINTFVNRGDSILTDTAYYPPYKNIAQLVDANLEVVDIAQLEEPHITSAKILLLNSPNNPTGKIYTEEELSYWAQLARTHNWLVVEDAVYNQIYFDKAPMSIAEFCPERTLRINSASKNLCMPGMRIGWVMGEQHLVHQVAKVHRNMNSSCSSFFQRVLAAYLPHSEYYFEGLRQEMRCRRDLFVSLCTDLGWQVEVPAGGIYAFVNIPELKDGFEFVEEMIQNINVSAIPGELFGKHFQTLRFCYGAMTRSDIEELGNRLKNWHYEH